MSFDWLFKLFLVVFLLIFGIDAVTNIEVTWMHPLEGFAALLAALCGGISLAKT